MEGGRRIGKGYDGRDWKGQGTSGIDNGVEIVAVGGEGVLDVENNIGRFYWRKFGSADPPSQPYNRRH